MRIITKLKTLLLFTFLFLVNFTFAQNRMVTGVVSTEAGELLPGVNVAIKGTTTGTITDVQGEFHIETNSESTLIFSFIGFGTVEMKVGSQTKMNVILSEGSEQLEEVIVVGFGEQKKENVTGSLETIGSETIKDRPVTSTSALFQGTLPGVVATQTSGQPGADNMDILIRGSSSINDTPALVIVDGMPMSMNNINPQDIESITVLKDASATAIYGAHAAGGVILITTKRGKEGKVSFGYNGYVGVQTPTMEHKFVGAVEFMELSNLARQNDGVNSNPVFTQDQIDEYRNGSRQGVNWRDAIMSSTAMQQQHNMTVSGGSEKVKYYGSGSFFDQGGLTPNTNFQRYNFRMNVDAKVNDRLTTHFKSAFDNSVRQQPTRGIGSAYYNANIYSPIDPIKWDNGEWNYVRNGNPVRWMEEGGDRTSNWVNTQLMLGAEYKIVDGLKAVVDYNFRYSHDRGKAFNNKHDYYDGDGKLVKTEPNWYEDYNAATTYSGLQARLDYEKHWNNHYLKAMVGYSNETQLWEQGSMTRYNYLTDNIHIIDAGSRDPKDWMMGGTADQWAIQSLYARVNYAFKDRYLFEANIRRDGSSKFGPSHRYGLFPSLSLGWRISEESFLKDVEWVTNLKVRGSWGKVGNQNIGSFDWTPTLAASSAVIGGEGVTAVYYDKTANPDIKWETKTTTNFGLEADFFGRLIGFTVDVFTNRTTDILMNVPVPPQFGYDAPRVNAGIVDNNGWEVSVRHQNQIGDFNYFVNLNLFDNRNNVVDILETGPWIDDMRFTDVGAPMRAWYGFRSDGIYQTDEEAKANTAHYNLNNNIGAGDIKLVDINGDGVIDGDDRELLGDPNPRYMFGINLGGSFKGFDFNILFNGALQRDVVLINEAAVPFFLQATPQEWQVEKAWPNSNEYPKFREEYTVNDPGRYFSDFWIQDGKYIRLKNVTVGYTFSADLLKKVGATSARIYVSGDNLWTSSALWSPTIDPEISNGSRGASYPQLSVYTTGISLNF
ncbi:TonB-dependent receptor [Flammeovirga yaeyamensis]|uniref:TonB-dependent receptor n=1 Tax=Flammeovirga yaeyamensis TaxID=367791 RepID=A0AAX1NCC5_9BACT|nr:TonB-dependent receptor [Flammeovirga yaeyamensis]MBB3698926.1 TonB-linked SusC/RagA family outer membrane protein [Flammeovirga yaeyamensis]NMF36361.1 TonB-dependent receptor [Flammeovirga yaeyamensis]QWG03678.1 TonB-dependent receptor [Flammeovirga yaeyamensis]